MITTIRNPQIASGFSNLAKVFGAPNAQAAIKADLAAKQRDYLLARTQGAQTDNTIKNNQLANTGILQSDLARFNELSQTPEGMAQIFSSVPGMGDAAMMKNFPAFLSGARASGMDPNFINSEDFGKVLLGTGVVNNYENTPQGQQAKFAADLNMQDDEQLFNVEHPELAGRKSGQNPTNYSPDNVGKIWEQTITTLESMGLSADGTTRNLLMPGIVERMRTNGGNIDQAIQEVLQDFTVEEYDSAPWLPWGGGSKRLKANETVAPDVPGPPPADVSADNPAAANLAPNSPPAAAGILPDPNAVTRAPLPPVGQGTDPNAPAATTTTIPDGATATNPTTGEKVIRQNGKWVPLPGPEDAQAPAPPKKEGDAGNWFTDLYSPTPGARAAAKEKGNGWALDMLPGLRSPAPSFPTRNPHTR